ncbi:MAG: ABC transporter permease, partial [Deltaproteobacteria bacterium]|nr:ABC transporter permease [Deltaproteobacteria bacterium]
MTGIPLRLNPYRDLFLIFIWREFSIRYRQSIIGVLWAILQPLSMMLLFTFIFTYIMPMHITDYPYVLFFYAGLLPWSFFSSSLNYAIPSLTNHYNLITKIYFPREILPLSGVAVAFIDFGFAS